MKQVRLTSITVSLEVEPKLENVIMELTSKTTLVTEFPFTIYDFKCQILVWWTSMKFQYSKVFVIWTRSLCGEKKNLK